MVIPSVVAVRGLKSQLPFSTKPIPSLIARCDKFFLIEDIHDLYTHDLRFLFFISSNFESLVVDVVVIHSHQSLLDVTIVPWNVFVPSIPYLK